MDFRLTSEFKPTGDQPQAIEKLVDLFAKKRARSATLLGVTGSGKTFTMANLIQALNRPTLVISHNKTLAAQLYNELREFFPDNAVEYFVSYYDYYQPEAYMPRTDTYIAKEMSKNEEIERLRFKATASLLARRDVIVVASVSCIYGLGDPADFREGCIQLTTGDEMPREELVRKLVEMYYTRNDFQPTDGTFRVRGEVLDVVLPGQREVLRVEYDGDRIDRLSVHHQVTLDLLEKLPTVLVYPAKQYVTTEDKLKKGIRRIREEMEARVAAFERDDKLVEAQRLRQRTEFDLEMLQVQGYCQGIENYSRPIEGRPSGSPPHTLIDFFPQDFLMIIDESHVTVPQVRGMYEGDRTRKETLVEYGFRLPSALDNRPLRFPEFSKKIRQVLYVSATPAPFEIQDSALVVEQIVRPTGVVDPLIEVRPRKNQVDDLIGEIRKTVAQGDKVLVTTLTKKMAEDLTDYLKDLEVRVQYLHSDIETLERIDVIEGLKNDVFDVIVGINLLREGLDLPIVGFIGILDADREGFLRGETALLQTVGRAARNIRGRVIMYADKETDAIRKVVDVTQERRRRQIEYNRVHGIEAVSAAVRHVRSPLLDSYRKIAQGRGKAEAAAKALADEDVGALIQLLEDEMKRAAAALEFERAATLRDEIAGLKKDAEKRGVLIAPN
ncbi:MAG TPA: excinuclease ABC subunit UvrB [Candidatus Thermoplasmatota archaeon]|nr:excinuclease ABC subunit UvrB [Candidatus Thermoplasmatota archaeon]